MKYLKIQKYGYFLIWGHGLRYRDDFLEQIRKINYLDILWLQKHKSKNMKKLIRKVYAYCDVPLSHIASKTSYLLTVPSETLFIFFRNNNPDERYFGEGPFKLLQCARIKKLKEELRNQYNPRVNGKRTEDHVIHASDNEIQVDYILKYLGYKNGLDFFNNQPNPGLIAPFYLEQFSSFRIKLVDTAQLLCNILIGDGNSTQTHTTVIQNSPQYASLSGNSGLYKNYISKYLGGPLKCDYSVEKLIKLNRHLSYLKSPNETAYIITTKTQSKNYLIIDGLHRAAVLLYRKINKFPVAVIQ